MKFWDNVGDPSYFQTLLADCLCHVSFSKYSSLSMQVVWTPNKCKNNLAPFFPEGRPHFLYGRLLARFAVHFGKVWLSSICWSLSAKPGNEIECRIFGVCVKTAVQFEAVCGPKFMLFWDHVGDPSWLWTQLPLMYCLFRSEDIGR